MFRPHHRVAVGVSGLAGRLPTSSTSLCTTLRAYTPIFAEDPATDRLAAQRRDDEKRALWGPSSIIPNQARALEAWLRFGNDPVVHTSLPADIPPALRRAEKEGASADWLARPAAASPFEYVEDDMGTNLVREDRPAHLQESMTLWSQYFAAKYVGRMRLSRRTAANVLGQVNAPDVLMDEADQPNTKWTQDTYFSEIAFLAERHLKEKTTTMEQLETALWIKSLGNVEGFLAFFEALQQQTQVRVPLPSPSVWFYEGEARQKWAAQFLPAAQAARQFVETVLAPEVKRLGGGSQGSAMVLRQVAKAFGDVHKVVIERAARQVKEGIRPAYATTADSAEKTNREAWCANELEREERAIQEGAYDPEDMLDSSDAWKSESKAIKEAMEKTIEGLSFSLKDFWLHMVRREALETQHVYTEDHFRDVAAAARNRLYEEGDTVAAICQSLETSMAGGSLDLRAGVFRPMVRRNPIWCKLHYAKFGSSAVVHHTLASRHQLQYAYAASLADIEAAATLYYDTKPLSSSLDYSSPYKFRNCLARLCASYELSLMRAAQMPFLSSAKQLSDVEATVGHIVQHVAHGYGVRRRARVQREQKQLQRLVVPIKSVTVCDVASEMLESGADDEAVRTPPRGGQTPIAVWPLGARKLVRVEWPSNVIEKLRLTKQAGPMTAERAAAIAELEQSARLEISLWRRQSSAEKQRTVARAAALAKHVENVVKSTPALAEVSAYARRFFDSTTQDVQGEESGARDTAPTATAEGEASAATETDWVFACMLDDNVPLTLEQAADVYLPYAYVDPSTGGAELLPQGEYVVRVRAYDRSLNPHELPSLAAEATSTPFQVFDALPQLQDQFFETSAPAGAHTDTDKGKGASTKILTHMRGEDLIPYCAFLREAGLDVPLRFEFAMGQSQDGQCRISIDHFLASLRAQTYHQSRAENGLTDVQRALEPRYHAHWSLYHPGADGYEWAAVRRRELMHAMSAERDWWLPDPLLHVPDVVTGSTGSNATALDFSTLPATTRYALESAAVLEASGTSRITAGATASASSPSPESTSHGLVAQCAVDGTGALTALNFGTGVTTAAANVTLEDAMNTALSAIQHAQTRHATLAMSRRAAFDKQTQAMLFCGVHGLPFGGKYARTYSYALEKAKKELTELLSVSGRAAVGFEDAEKTRLSEHEKPDRYASATHPEQRRTRFADRVNLAGQRMEDLQPDQTTTWNR